MDAATSSFYRSARNISRDPKIWISEILESELPRAVSRVTNNGTRLRELTGDCFIMDSGDLITYLLDLLSEVATTLVKGKYMQAYLRRKVSSLEDYDDLIDLDGADQLDIRHAALKSICEQLETTAAQISERWETTLSETDIIQDQASDVEPSERSYSVSSSSRQQREFTSPTPRTWGSPRDSQYPSSERTAGSFPGFGPDDFDDRHEDFDIHYELDMERGIAESEGGGSHISSSPFSRNPYRDTLDLDKRGTGNHVCPYGFDCKKGGCINGELRVFKRNSEYRYASLAEN
ncbi:hypothetical protein ABW19_dt0203082 [Dactylella cylindrospora]|nr:hypothetical protein ABW19_dt0203082 [Dactylella cylindrospora]